VILHGCPKTRKFQQELGKILARKSAWSLYFEVPMEFMVCEQFLKVQNITSIILPKQSFPICKQLSAATGAEQRSNNSLASWQGTNSQFSTMSWSS
jgi:hypothetical protein